MISIRYIVFILVLLSGCAQAPQAPQQSYWHIIAEDHMYNGLQYYQRQQFRPALNQFERALKTYQRFNDVDGEINSRINLAKTSIALHQLDAAKEQIKEARQMIAEHSLKDRTVYLDIMASSMAIGQGDLEQAAGILDGYADDAPLTDDVRMALLVNKIRLAFENSQDPDALIERLEQAVKNQPRYEPRLWRFQALQARKQQAFETSDEYYQRALHRYRKDAHSLGVMAVLEDWAGSFAQRGQWEQAAQRYRDMYKTALSVKLQQPMETALDGLKQAYGQLQDEQQLEWVREQEARL